MIWYVLLLFGVRFVSLTRHDVIVQYIIHSLGCNSRINTWGPQVL